MGCTRAASWKASHALPCQGSPGAHTACGRNRCRADSCDSRLSMVSTQ